MKTIRSRPPGYRLQPEKIILEPKPSASSTQSQAPVRIFVGTETAQARAERIFVWSIEKVRNPSRTYEIFLMKELVGFDRRRWLTGFTNYRFAIPELAGGIGRAIYNDVDQIYLSDPGELFDINLGDHGFLSIAENDSSVMIMDCARMHPLWTIDRARHERKSTLLNEALHTTHLWGKLDPAWNARDEEYVEGQSKVLHYTALHTQPWHPFPQEFVYQESPVGHVWKNLKESADSTGFHLFDRDHPSSQFAPIEPLKFKQHVKKNPSNDDSSQTINTDDLHPFIASLPNPTLLYFHMEPSPDKASRTETTPQGSSSDVSIDHWSPFESPRPEKLFDIVYGSERLTLLPDEDIPWILEEIFSLASRLVMINIRDTRLLDTTPSYIPNHSRDFHWWASHLQAMSSRYPTLHWSLRYLTSDPEGQPSALMREGGRWLSGLPRVWILSDGKIGHATQSEGLAQSLCWPYETKHLSFQSWNSAQKLLWSVLPPHTYGLDKKKSSILEPPWPDIIISTGWRPAPIARWIREQNEGKTRIIQVGRKGGGSADLFDVVVTPAYYGFTPHPHRIETLAPLNELTQERVDAVSQRWPNLFGSAPHPRIVLVIGGSTARFRLTPDFAYSIGTQIKDLANACSGKVFVVTSPRTGNEVSQTLKSVFTPEHQVHQWQPNQSDNPYFAYLAGADIIIVTGESESMLAEAASLGKSVYIIPLPENPPTWKIRLSEAIVARAQSRPLNKRGTVRPQQGIERLCARLIRAGLVQPRRDLSLLHQSLIQKGIARPFGEPLDNGARPQLRETERVAKQIKAILGIFDHEHVSS